MCFSPLETNAIRGEGVPRFHYNRALGTRASVALIFAVQESDIGKASSQRKLQSDVRAYWCGKTEKDVRGGQLLLRGALNS